MEETQTLEARAIDLTEKYKNRVNLDLYTYDHSSLRSVLNRIESTDKKINNLYNKIIEQEIPFKERFTNKTKEFLAKLHLGQMPDKIDVMTVFERRFEEIEEIADTLKEQTNDAYSKVEVLKNHLKLIRSERTELQNGYTNAFNDAKTLHEEIMKYEDLGVSIHPWKNKGTDEQASILMDYRDAYKNAFATYENLHKNFLIRADAIITSQFYYDVVLEMANTGQQAFDDIILIIREMKTMIENSVTCKDMIESIIKSDKMLGTLSNYLGKMTKITMDYMGVAKEVRVNKGGILSDNVMQGLKEKYERIGDERDNRIKEIEKASKTIYQGN